MSQRFLIHTSIAAALAAAAFAVYAQTAEFDFVNLDDGAYLYLHTDAQRGLSLDSIRWAFTTLYLANYTPLTWLTYFADYHRAGLDPGVYHLTNTLFHAANGVLLYFALHALTRRVWPSALVAALFALHPLHVESVAWISERKDVLSTFFGLLALWAYAAYASAPGLKRYLIVFALFTCSLLSKPMLVTFPFLLLVLDFWPLNRAALSGTQRPVWIGLVLEKIPMIMLAAVISLIAIIAQREANALPGREVLGLGARAANAAVAYVRYLTLTVWPQDLIPYYPHPNRGLPVWQVAGSAALLLVVSVTAWRLRDRAPYLLAGWLWYLGTLVPVIGLVQVGGQAIADRYTYVPLIGVFVAAAWAFAGLAERFPRARYAAAAAAVAVLALLGTLAHMQTALWRNSITLYEHTLRISPNNLVALPNLGEAFLTAKRYEDAVTTIERALAIAPESAGSHGNLALALRALGKPNDAIAHLLTAVRLEPDSPKHRNNLALVQMDLGEFAAARQSLEQALAIDPSYTATQVNMGNVFLRQNDPDTAESHYYAALALEPRNADALSNLGAVHLMRGEFSPAETRLREALAITPDDPVVRTNLGGALLGLGDLDGARLEAEIALRLDPDYAKAETLLQEIEKRTPR